MTVHVANYAVETFMISAFQIGYGMQYMATKEAYFVMIASVKYVADWGSLAFGD